MKKIFLSLSLLVVSITACAQNSSSANEPLYYQNIENSNEINLTPKQREEIRRINREIGPKFEQIGRDRSLSGYEKGQRKRELALKHKNEIFNVLTSDQQRAWEKKYSNNNSSIRNNVSDYADNKLENLEQRYKADKKAIEKNSSLSKDEKKYRKKELDKRYKIDKQRLKDAKESAKHSGLLEGR